MCRGLLTRPISKLEGFDKDFRSIHYEIVDLIEKDSDDLEKGHEVLDKHEDDVTALAEAHYH